MSSTNRLPGRLTLKRKKTNPTMCEVALQFGLLIRTRKLFLLFLLVFNSNQLCRKLTFCLKLLTVACLGQFKAKLQFVLQVLFLDYHLPLICELAKQLNALPIVILINHDTNCIYNITLAWQTVNYTTSNVAQKLI